MFGDHFCDTSEELVLSDYPCDQCGKSSLFGLGQCAWLSAPWLEKMQAMLRTVCVCMCLSWEFNSSTKLVRETRMAVSDVWAQEFGPHVEEGLQIVAVCF